MKVSGFSFIRNAQKIQYPIVEAIQSILPICDEVIVAVGHSEDNTRELVAAIDPKVKILDTVWDESSRIKGRVLAEETDKAFQHVGSDADWCVYIQGDEVMHENGYDEIRDAMLKWKDHKKVDGLLFNYLHFFGSYKYIGAEGRWYRNEIRIVKNDKSIYSFRDAQGFRKAGNKMLQVKSLNAKIHHYGWVLNSKTMKAKMIIQDKIYRNMKVEEDKTEDEKQLPYLLVKALHEFSGIHPQVMKNRIENFDSAFEFDISKNRFTLKDHFKKLIEKLTGKRYFYYQNYKII